jgi:L-ascorbate metabolism protein UlaG (beta-lactamase superfamily)
MIHVSRSVTSHVLVFTLCMLIPVVVSLSCMSIQSLGKNPSGEDLKKIEALPNYRNGSFQNLEDFFSDMTTVSVRKFKWHRMLKYFLRKPKNTRPLKPIPSIITDLTSNPYTKPTVIWFGHSSFLLKTATANILFDPNFSAYAGPFKGMIAAFEGTMEYAVKHLPVIDALVISHDHYDHLDYRTVNLLKKKVKRVIVPIGVGSHFRKWGYKPEKITELNWDETIRLNDQLHITATPAHHRSNRTMAQRKTLWASYVVEADGFKVYFSGDTGYSQHFKRIGEQYGPFDLALLECGQYNLKWPRNHMFPHQTARAALDLKTAMTIPIHWARFAESEHPWNEPVNLLLASADSLKVPISIPFIGQPYTIGDTLQRIDWWNF